MLWGRLAASQPTNPCRAVPQPSDVARAAPQPSDMGRAAPQPSSVGGAYACCPRLRTGRREQVVVVCRVPLARLSRSLQIAPCGHSGAVDALHVCRPPARALWPFSVCQGPCKEGQSQCCALARRRTTGGTGRAAGTRHIRDARVPSCCVACLFFTRARRLRARLFSSLTLPAHLNRSHDPCEGPRGHVTAP